jgi:hypothetical protein
MDEPTLNRYLVYLCSLCVAGEGGECHTPGCAFYMSSAPDLPLTTPMVRQLPEPSMAVKEVLQLWKSLRDTDRSGDEQTH